jgi:hypothetical protein
MIGSKKFSWYGYRAVVNTFPQRSTEVGDMEKS